jgi:uncharacterized protein YkwD
MEMITFRHIAAVLLLAASATSALAEVQFAIGEPAEGSVKSGIGQVSGWAISDREIVSVEAFIDGASLGLVPYGGSRLDVAAAFPQYPDAEFSGWAMKWNYALHEPGEHVLTIVVTEDDGTQTSREVLFSTTRFRSEFIGDPGAVRTENALISSPARGRLKIEGAEVEGEIVDLELAWDRASQQFLIDTVTYDGQQIQNQSPKADAGPNLTAETGAEVSVQGHGSDPDGVIVDVSWQQVSGPGVSLAGADQWTVSFTAPAQAGDVRLRLTVVDDQGMSDSDDVIIAVAAPNTPPPNQAPSANAGADRTVQPGDGVTITGSGSDADGTIVGFSWAQVSGSAVSLSGAGTQTVQFSAPNSAGDIRLRLTVTDDDGATDTDDVVITVEAPQPPPNQAPSANAGADRTVQQGDSVTIVGGGSDADGSIVGFSWTQVSGSAVGLSGAGTQTVQFTAPSIAGDIRLRLTVTDDDGATDTDDVVITVEASSDPGNTTGSTLQSMLDDINAARGQEQDCGGTIYPSQPPLQWSASLADIAMQHSMDMAQNGYFSHTSLDGTTMGSRVFPYWSGNRVGENIAASSADRTDNYVVGLWLDSPGHCALLMDPDFTHVGVGKGHDPDNGYTYKYFWTMDVGG